MSASRASIGQHWLPNPVRVLVSPGQDLLVGRGKEESRAGQKVNVLSRVRDFVRRRGLLEVGDGIVVGVSGGPDSLCLLHVLLKLREQMRLRLHVAHLHHGARGEEADADASFVEDLARGWELPVTVVRQDVPAIARAHGLAFEETARRVRYAFLAHVAGEVGATKVAVGHNADDQTETVLMHFLRGAGPAGLRGMLPATPLSTYRLLTLVPGFPLPPSPPTLVRPLLEVPRAAVEEYCARHGLEPRFDRSNLDTTFFRNRLRHELLPLLEGYSSNLPERLRRTAEVAAADYALLSQLRDAAWQEVIRAETGQAIVFDRAAWQAQHLSVQRALIRKAAYRLRGQLRDVSFVHVESAVVVGREGRTGAQATLPGGLSLSVAYDSLTIADAGYDPPPEGPSLAPGQEVKVSVGEGAALPGGVWVLEATPASFTLAEVEADPDCWTAYLDAEALGEPLILRTRRRGDRFRPQGMGGHAPRLADWMINAKVPRSWRDRLPLLVTRREIVWVCGWRVAETAVVGPDTKQTIRFRFRQTERETEQ